MLLTGIPSHPIPYHTIPYHTIPYHWQKSSCTGCAVSMPPASGGCKMHANLLHCEDVFVGSHLGLVHACTCVCNAECKLGKAIASEHTCACDGTSACMQTYFNMVHMCQALRSICTHTTCAPFDSIALSHTQFAPPAPFPSILRSLRFYRSLSHTILHHLRLSLLSQPHTRTPLRSSVL